MAELTIKLTSISSSAAVIRWEITGMNTAIVRGGICERAPDGTTDDPGVLSSSSASGGDASGTYRATKSKYPSGKFTCYGYGKSVKGEHYPAGGGQKSLSWDWPPERPSDWSWRSAIAPGKPIAITASEWHGFCNRIDEFLVYTGRARKNWKEDVKPGDPISASVVNEARAAIAPMTTAQRPPYVEAGKTAITAQYFEDLKEYLNSVP